MALIPVIIILLVLSGCRSYIDYYDADGNVDISKMLISMSARSVKALKLPEQPDSLEDIPGGKIDAAVLGDWVTAENSWFSSQRFTFKSEGEFEINQADFSYGGNYTCVVAGGLRVLCCEYHGLRGNEYVYYAYNVKNGALYLVPLEKPDGDADYSAIMMCLYKFAGGFSVMPEPEAVENNPVSLSSFYGEWKINGTSVKIDPDGLKVGDSVYKVHLSDNAKLIVEKDGSSSKYLFYLYYERSYKDESRTEIIGESLSLKLYYLEEDGNDKSNLLEEIPGWEYKYDYPYKIILSRPL